MNDSIGPWLTPNTPPSQPHWKITTITPSAAPMLSRFITAACSGITSERKTIISSSALSSTTTPMNSGSLWLERAREVDGAGGHAAHVDGHARARGERRDDVLAQARDQLGGRVGLRRGVRIDA